MWDEPLSEAIETLVFKDKTVGDFGGGLGHYTKKFRTDGLVKSVECIDGAFNVYDVTGGLCSYADLTEPLNYLPVYDWILSLEVGEHIPQPHELSFVSNLYRHSAEGVVISWAVPGQYGLSHVNEKTNEDVIAMFESATFYLDSYMTETLRNSVGPKCPWFKGSLMVFRKKSDP